MYLGEALLRSGRIAAAEKAFSRASLSANPDFLLSLAQRVYTHNYWQEAIEVLQKALAPAPRARSDLACARAHPVRSVCPG
jgi:tetratricopeptide (TPR) repeat protein